jgi:hypothetical protein
MSHDKRMAQLEELEGKLLDCVEKDIAVDEANEVLGESHVGGWWVGR